MQRPNLSQTISNEAIETSVLQNLQGTGLPVIRVSIISKRLAGGYICTTLRISATYASISDSFKYPPTFVVKLEETASADHEIASSLQLYNREWLFFRNISNLVLEAGVRCPKYFGSVYDQNGREIGVILEDLCLLEHPSSVTGAITSFVLAPRLSDDTLIATVKTVASLHAGFGSTDEVARLEKAGLQRLNGPWFRPSWSNDVQRWWPTFYSKWHERGISAEALSALQNAVSRLEFAQDHLSNGWVTLLHGDVKPGNLFLLFHDGQDAPEPALIDWQYVAIGKGICDLVFFATEGFPEDRAICVEQIVMRVYHDELLKRGIEYPLADMTYDWAVALTCFTTYVCMWFGNTPDDALVDKSFPERIIRRASAALIRRPLHPV